MRLWQSEGESCTGLLHQAHLHMFALDENTKCTCPLSCRAMWLRTEKQLQGEPREPTGMGLSDVHPRSKPYDREARDFDRTHRKHRIGG